MESHKKTDSEEDQQKTNQRTITSITGDIILLSFDYKGDVIPSPSQPLTILLY